MQNWIILFAVALLIVAAAAAGPMAPVVVFLAFWITLYLLWARQLGFKDAWASFGLHRLKPPLWNSENRRHFAPFLEDQDKLVKSAAVALGLIALGLMIPPAFVRIIAVVALIWYISEIYRAQRVADRLDNARFN
ncbi:MULTISPECIES: hypothetical protein [Rhodopseudomonas]|uniref:Transmembrane protein n=1 Tax=Rhodopseudomonas palustris TaxID=1076 RepID=A0A0D7EC46_RHOPL|nr:MULTISPECIES: hypothetical protein [Rhodopseudomonas]KIZ38409.1 hypothetical protein OO17_22820 [Rhodopseudomonas palustris]MDF3811424.1 hypothetical protein [Rhodopseudomonas sp. BAL398]WOK16279.1 hypothetical protein RBJ75_19240 [Rhodopseudomonas sp. BAL398]